MKKKVTIILWVLFGVTAVYTPVAALLVRGLGIYRLDTTLGMVLACSWQYTALAAAVLLAAVGIPLALRLIKTRQEKLAAAPAQADVPEEEKSGKKPEKKQLLKKTFRKMADAVQPVPIQAEAPASSAAAEAPIPPAPPAQQEQQTEKLAPAAPAEPVPAQQESIDTTEQSGGGV